MTTRLAALALPVALLLAPVMALAQTTSTPGGPPANLPPQPQPAPFQNPPRYQAGMQYQDPGAGGTGRKQGMTRQAFVARAAEMAGQRFDEMDSNHDGLVSTHERMTYWQSRRGNGGSITVHDGPAGGP